MENMINDWRDPVSRNPVSPDRDRRNFLKQAGTIGSIAMGSMVMSQGAFALGAASNATPGGIREESLAPQEPEPPKYRIRFGVCGISHDHIYGMIGAMQRGGGELVAAWGGEPDKLAAFTKRFPGVKMVTTENEIIEDLTLQLVLSSQIANERAPIGVKVMRYGKDFLSDKPGITTVRLDWFTPDGLGTWGDGRLFILGTEGYIEVRKYTNVAVGKQGNNLFIVDKNQARYIDCNNMPLPFGPEFIADIVNRTHIAQDQDECLLAAELSIQAQKSATRVTLEA